MRSTSLRRYGAPPVSVRLDTMRGAARQTPEATIIPSARRLSFNWPGGGWIYAWPTAVEIRTAQGTRRTPIIPAQTVLSSALVSIALAALVGSIARWSLNQRHKPGDKDGRRMRSEGR